MKPEDVYMWLFDVYNSAYLRWIVIWLSGALAISNTLIQVSNVNNKYTSSLVVKIIYLGILLGMSFSVYRLTNIVKKQMKWYHDLLNLDLDLPFDELYRDRGFIQKFFVDDNGKIRECHRLSFIILQFIFSVAILAAVMCASATCANP